MSLCKAMVTRPELALGTEAQAKLQDKNRIAKLSGKKCSRPNRRGPVVTEAENIKTL